MSAVQLLVLVAIVLAGTGLHLAHRAAPRPTWRELCPQCQMPLWLPLRQCPLCHGNLESEEYREAIALSGVEAVRKRRALLHTGQVLLLMACVAILVACLLALDPALTLPEGWTRWN